MSFSLPPGAAVDSESHKTLAKALELGCTFWDSAVVYGCGHNEQLIGDFFRANPGAREKVFIASKCGIEVSNLCSVLKGDGCFGRELTMTYVIGRLGQEDHEGSEW
jgi:aryl-alcohol dehydrogenase-like predicted oxidoreductase